MTFEPPPDTAITIITEWEPRDCGACGDHNLDGSIDGFDIEPFLADWQDGQVDQTCDGVCDAADLIAFFTAWENATCVLTRSVECIGC